MRFNYQGQTQQSDPILTYNKWHFGLSGSDQKPSQSRSNLGPNPVMLISDMLEQCFSTRETVRTCACEKNCSVDKCG